MPGGFNVTSGEPMDSRTIVEDINHIYEEGNWTKVKPYKGLIVSSRDGQIRVCIDDKNYTNKEAWVEIGSGMGTEVVNTYEEAIPLATEETIGQIVYIKTESQYPEGEGETYSAGPYIVTGAGALAKIGTTTASGDIAGDVETLKGKVGTLETSVSGLTTKVSDAEGDIDTLQSNLTSLTERVSTAEGDISTAKSDIDAVEARIDVIEGEEGGYKNKIESISVAGQDISPIDKKVSITFEDTIEDDSVVENAPKTKAVSAKLKELKQQITAIPKFNIQVVEENPETHLPNVPEPSTTTVYLVLSSEGDENNLYTEWIYNSSQWEKLGVQKVDLSEYAKTSEVTEAISTAKSELQNSIDTVDAKFANYTDTSTLSSTYALKTEVESAKSEAISSANSYTDSKISEVNSGIDSKIELMAETLRGELSTDALTEEEILGAISTVEAIS